MSRAIDDITWRPMTAKERVALRQSEAESRLDALEVEVSHLIAERGNLHMKLFEGEANMIALSRVLGDILQTDDFLSAVKAAKQAYLTEVRLKVDMRHAKEDPLGWVLACIAVAASMSEARRSSFERFWAEICQIDLRDDPAPQGETEPVPVMTYAAAEEAHAG